MDDEDEKRMALNEAMFREINERLESQIPTFAHGRPELSIICECVDPDCTERITLTPEEYSAVRTDPRQFVVSPGHTRVDVEEVVIQNDRYEVVRKVGVAGRIADQTSDD